MYLLITVERTLICKLIVIELYNHMQDYEKVLFMIKISNQLL